MESARFFLKTEFRIRIKPYSLLLSLEEVTPQGFFQRHSQGRHFSILIAEEFLSRQETALSGTFEQFRRFCKILFNRVSMEIQKKEKNSCSRSEFFFIGIKILFL